MAKEESQEVKIIPEYGKYSFKQRLNRMDLDEVLYAGQIKGALIYISVHQGIGVPKEQLKALIMENYKYVIIKV